MNIKEKKGFITIYTTLAMIFLITIITVSLIIVSRKLRNQAQLNTEIYKAYNQDDMSNIIVDYATEIPIYTKEQFEHLRNWVKNEDRKTEYMLINGYLYKLDPEKYDEYKATLRTDLYYEYEEHIEEIEIIKNGYEIIDYSIAYAYDGNNWTKIAGIEELSKLDAKKAISEAQIVTKFYKKNEKIFEDKMIIDIDGNEVELTVQESDYSYKLVIEGEGKMPSLIDDTSGAYLGYQEGINALFTVQDATVKEYLLIPYVTEVEISDGITSIGEWSFICANALKEVNIPKNIENIGSYAFVFSKIKTINLEEGVERIDSYAFQYCSELEKITIPSSLITIDNNAFQFCYKLSNIEFSEGLESIGERAFYGCTSLENLTLPNNIKTISNYAFGYCENLKEITIPNSIMNIGTQAFLNCSNLNTVYMERLIISNLTLGENIFISTGTNLKIYVKNEEIKEYIKNYIGNDSVIIVVQ